MQSLRLEEHVPASNAVISACSWPLSDELQSLLIKEGYKVYRGGAKSVDYSSDGVCSVGSRFRCSTYVDPEELPKV